MTTSYYNPILRAVILRDGASKYERYHEEAHQAQHDEKCLCWRVWHSANWVRGIEYLVTLWIEYDAYLRARREMIKNGDWNSETEKEARQGLLSYLKRKTL